MRRKNRPNQKVVTTQGIEHIEEFIHTERYKKGMTKKDILKLELEMATVVGANYPLCTKVNNLVDSGFFLIYTEDITEFLESLNLTDNAMRKTPEATYKQVIYHTVERYLKH